MKNFILLALTFFSVISAVETEPNSLLNTTNQYFIFVNRIGGGEVVELDEASTLFEPNCRKIFNGNLATSDRDDFVMDLLSVYNHFGSWKLIPVEIIDGSKDNVVVFRAIIDSKCLGIYTAIVILKFSKEGLISEINEVFSPVEDQYEFCTN